MKNLNARFALLALSLAVLSGVNSARADGTVYTFSPTGSSLLKAGNWYLNGVNVQTVPTAAGTIGSISEAGGTTTSNGPLGWNTNTNVGGTFGTIDIVSGATDQVVGTYTTKSTSTNNNITLEGATLNSIANTVIANSSGTGLLFQNDIDPSGDYSSESALTIYTLANSSNAIQSTAGSNIIIDDVITGSSDALTYYGGGNASTTGATLELGAGSANDVTDGTGNNAPVKANAGTFVGPAVVQSSDKNTFTGGLTVGDVGGTANAGIVQVDGGNALPTTGAVTVNTNSQLLLNGSSTYGGSSQTVNLNGTGTGGTGNGALATGSADTSTLQATVNVASASAVSVNGSSKLTVTGQLTGSSQLQSVGTGTLQLNGSNTGFSGGTVVSGGSLVSGNTNSLGTGAVTVSGGTLSTAITTTTNVGGTLALSSGGIVLASVSAPTLTLASGQNFQMTGGTLSLTYNLGTVGSIASAGGSSSFAITSGTLNLNSSFTGEYGSTYDILNGFGSGSVSGLSITGYDSTDYTANLSNAGVLSFTANATAPEPGSLALVVGGLACLIGIQNLRRRNHLA